MKKEDILWLKEYFDKLRFDEYHHLGLGDIRLTISQQNYIIKKVKSFISSKS